jgi:hypothetical protein
MGYHASPVTDTTENSSSPLDHHVERSSTTEGLPVAPSMGPAIEAAGTASQAALVDGRTVMITFICIGLAAVTAVVAQALVRLIFFVTNLSFYGRLSFTRRRRGSITSGWASSSSR